MTDMTAVAIRPRKNATNERFANDGSYESIERQLHKLALRFHSRALAIGMGMELEDIQQELRVFYLKARAKWSPERGVRFATYFQTTCYNNFNDLCDRHTRPDKDGNQRGIFLMSTEDLASNRDPDYSDDGDMLEFMEQDEDGEESHEDRLIRSEELRERLASLSPNAKRLITALLMSEKSSSASEPPKLAELVAQIGFTEKALTDLRKEIRVKFGVTWR